MALGGLLTSCKPDDSIAQAKEQSIQQFNEAGISNMENDALFAAEAASANLLQIELGQAAMEKAVSPEVKQLAEQLANDHRQMQDDLETLASQTHLVLPDALGDVHQEVYDNLTDKSGIGYDLSYISTMEEQHEDMVRRYEDMAENGVSMEVKKYASKQLPLLRQHLEKATVLEDLVNDAS